MGLKPNLYADCLPLAKANGNKYLLPLTSVNGYGLRPCSWMG